MDVNTKKTIEIKDVLCILLHNKPKDGCTMGELMTWNELVESFKAVFLEKYPDSKVGINFIFKEVLDD
jgi:hypothetical protein